MGDSTGEGSAPGQDELTAAVESSLFEAIGVGVYTIDADGLICSLNPKGAALLGWTAEQCQGLSAQETFHLSGDSTEVSPIVAVARTGQPNDSESDTFRRVDGSLLPVWWTATPIYGRQEASDGPLGAVVAFADRTSTRAATVADAAAHVQVSSDLGAARQAVSDLGWASEVTQALASAPEESEALTRLARMAVPRLCQLIVVHRVDDRGHRQRVAAAAAPDLGAQVERAVEESARPGKVAPNVPIGVAIPGAVTVVEGPDLESSPIVVPDTKDLLASIGSGSVMVVPMVARGHVVAVAEMINTADGAAFEEADRLAAVDLARRVGLAVDNLRLLQAERSAAIILQEALLPVLGDLPGLRLGWRYLPAGDIHRVGGDWYDAFACPDETATTVLVIGDVAGHDLGAATDMAAIRNLLRGIAVSVPTDPAGLLSAVDQHLDALGITTTGTVIVATLSRQDRRGGATPSWTMKWSNAGHLAPILVGPDGAVERLDSQPEPLLGTGTSPVRTAHIRDLAPGSSIIFYTDGLIEQAGEDLEAGIERLVTAARHAATAGDTEPEAILDGVLGRIPRNPDDDTAMLVAYLE